MNRFNHEVKIPVGKIWLEGELIVPMHANSIVVFSHGSGSSRLSPRNIQVARHLHKHNFGTFLFDLLTREEDRFYHNRFNIDLLAKRLIRATEWLETHPAVEGCRIGYFGASTGAASALMAAADLSQIAAVVSRGGRPDLAMEVLHKVKAPTLLIVGSLDDEVLKLNQQAFNKLHCQKRLEIIDGATHLFEEHGKIEEVSVAAAKWFNKYLKPVTVQ